MPAVASPVEKVNEPEEPPLVVPVLKLMCPLTPVVPASAVNTNTEPLVELSPLPLSMDNTPPVADPELPASKLM